jgi:hypothetical protein
MADCFKRLPELKEELALGINMVLNSWHLHHEILQVLLTLNFSSLKKQIPSLCKTPFRNSRRFHYVEFLGQGFWKRQ